ncbi:MAG: response regulator, partial [Rhizobacter sp.]|nr:response regulator [Rhizobacter sp.]
GDDAILMAREHKPDLALLDIRMEGKSGFDVAAYLRDSHQTPFMFLSAFSDEATVAQVKALGAVAYLVKPLDISQIVPVVDKAFQDIRAGRIAPRAAGVAPNHDVLAAVVPMAIGVLMHRYSLARGQALERLQRMASSESRPIEDQARRLLEAVEMLSSN